MPSSHDTSQTGDGTTREAGRGPHTPPEHDQACSSTAPPQRDQACSNTAPPGFDEATIRAHRQESEADNNMFRYLREQLALAGAFLQPAQRPQVQEPQTRQFPTGTDLVNAVADQANQAACQDQRELTETLNSIRLLDNIEEQFRQRATDRQAGAQQPPNPPPISSPTPHILRMPPPQTQWATGA